MMRKIAKKMLALVLAVFMLAGVMPVLAVEASADDFAERFPVGSYAYNSGQFLIFINSLENNLVYTYCLAFMPNQAVGSIPSGGVFRIVSHGHLLYEPEWRTHNIRLLEIEFQGIRGYIAGANWNASRGYFNFGHGVATAADFAAGFREPANAPEPDPEPTTEPALPAVSENLEVGNLVQFGDYVWRVLDVEEDRALLLTEYVIFNRVYYHGMSAPSAMEIVTTWETSGIRNYLNGNFFNRFDPEDQERIAATTVINDDNQWFGTDGGNDTTDRIFLLSIEEVVRYFGDSGLLNNQPARATAINDEYNPYREAFNLDGLVSMWWLRSPGTRPGNAAIIHWTSSSILMTGWIVSNTSGVRPALWLYFEE